MKLYILVNLQDTDDTFGAHITPFTEKETAQTFMRESLEATVKDWGFDTTVSERDDHYIECQENSAVIHDGDNEERWQIEEHNINVRVAVEVRGGLVANVYANVGLDAEVFDLDVSDFPDEGEQEAADAREKELQELIESPEWGRV